MGHHVIESAYLSKVILASPLNIQVFRHLAGYAAPSLYECRDLLGTIGVWRFRLYRGTCMKRALDI